MTCDAYRRNAALSLCLAGLLFAVGTAAQAGETALDPVAPKAAKAKTAAFGLRRSVYAKRLRGLWPSRISLRQGVDKQ